MSTCVFNITFNKRAARVLSSSSKNTGATEEMLNSCEHQSVSLPSILRKYTCTREEIIEKLDWLAKASGSRMTIRGRYTQFNNGLTHLEQLSHFTSGDFQGRFDRGSPLNTLVDGIHEPFPVGTFGRRLQKQLIIHHNCGLGRNGLKQLFIGFAKGSGFTPGKNCQPDPAITDMQR